MFTHALFLPIARSRRREIAVALLYAVFSIALLSPMASDTPTSAPDLSYHLVNIVQAKLAIDQGQFPLRTAPLSYDGWGYPLYQFYGQLPYTVAGLVYKYLTPANPYVAFKLILWAMLTLAGYFVYRLSFWLTRSRVASILAGVIYAAAPYFLINIHARGAFAEACAQGVLPLVIYASVRSYASRKPVWLFAAGLSWFALATTHIITFEYAAIFAGLFFLLMGIIGRKNIVRLARVGAAFALGCVLAMYFLAPVATASYLVIRNRVGPPIVSNWLTPLPALLSPTSIPPEPQPGQLTTPNLHPAVGWPMLIAAAIVLYVVFFVRDPAEGPTKTRISARLLVLFALALFMTWSPIDFWSPLPEPLRVVEFPYRMLTQVMWTGALLSAFALDWLFKGRLDRRHLAAGLLLVGMASSSYLPSLQAGSIKLPDLVTQPELVKTTGENDYLAKADFFNSGPMLTKLENIPLTFADGWLKLDQPYLLSECPPQGSPGLILRIKGDVPTPFFTGALTLSVALNHEVIGRKQLGAGPFEWTDRLDDLSVPGDRQCSVEFSADQTFEPSTFIPGSGDDRTLAVRASTLSIGDDDPNHNVIPVSDSRQMCHPRGTENVCEVTMPLEARWLQLPVLYYPGLVTISANGHKTDYEPLVDQGLVFAAMRLEPGVYDIQAQFQGLVWANWVSLVSWLAFIVVLSTMALCKLYRWVRVSRE